MAQRGRPRKPDQLKDLEGNPGKRQLNKSAPEATGAPVRPAYVKGYARKIWNAIIDSMPPSLYATCDSSLLAAYCVAAATHRQATIEIEKEGAVAFGKYAEDKEGNLLKGAPYQNPWVSILNRQAQLLATLGSRLGLDPAARSGLKMPKGEQKKSKFADLIPIKGGPAGQGQIRPK